MSSADDKLAKVLGENGAFDPERARESGNKAVSAFGAQMRKTERRLYAYLCLYMWLFVFAGAQFLNATSTKEMLFNGLLALIFFEMTILMKLWYSGTNSRIAVLKEIKQLRLQGAEDGEPQASSQEAKELAEPLKGLSRRERCAWWAALIGGALLVVVVKSHDAPFWPSSLSSRSCVMLAADGSGSAETEMSVVVESIRPTESFRYHAPESATLRFVDGRGRELPFTTSPHGGHVRYDVSLIDPVGEGRRYTYTRLSESPRLATETDGTWTYTSDVSYGYGTNELSQTVVLPQRAEIVSATPWPAASFTLNGRPAVRFEATRGPNEPFEYTVRYRLETPEPAEDAGE